MTYNMLTGTLNPTHSPTHATACFVCDLGAGRYPQVSEVRYNGTDGDRRQRQHGSQYRHQVWNPQTRRRLSRVGRQRVQPEDTRNSRRTGKPTSHRPQLYFAFESFQFYFLSSSSFSFKNRIIIIIITPVHSSAAGECSLLPQHNEHRIRSRCSRCLTFA